MKKLAFLLLMVVAFVTTSMAQVDTNKMYRLKDNATSQYLTAHNYDEHAGGAYGGVGTSALAEDNEAQIFIFEQSGSNYKIKTKTGYYIYAQQWNVDALSSKSSEFKFTANGTAGYYMQVYNTNNGNAWCYVKNEYVSDAGGYYIFGDAAVGAAATWTFEEVAVDVPSRTITVSANNDAWGTVSGGGIAEGAITITATPADGCKFVEWQLNGIQISTQQNYIDETEGDKEYVAIFAELEPYELICKPTFNKAGNTTFVSAATILADGETSTIDVAELAVLGQQGFVNVGETYAGATFDLNLTYTLNWGDLSLYQIAGDEATSIYGPFEGSWVDGGSTSTVLTNIVNAGLTVEGTTVTYPITISSESQIGDLVVIRAITGATSACETGITEGGYIDFVFTVATPPCTVTATSSNVAMGTVTPEESKINSGNNITLTATPNEGYEFVNWTVAGEEVSTDATYTFTVTQDIEVVANFQIIPGTQTFNITVSSANETMGSVEASTLEVVDGNTVILTVTANDGYRFVNWTVAGEEVSTENPYTATITAETAFVANFVKVYNVTATAENGNVTISGQNAEGTFDENSTATLTATPNNGYLFTNWTLNGSVVGNATTLEVTVTADAQYVANFEKTYCTYSGNSTNAGRYLNSFTLTDGTNQVAVSNIQTAQSAVYVDKTTSVLTTNPGATLSFSELNWTGLWMHGYVFIDYNNDKEFNGTDNNNGTTGGELVTYSAYTSSDGNTFKDINGNLTPDSDGSGSNDSQEGDGGNGVSVSSIPSWTLPADLAPGNYRLRFNIVWNTKDACGYADMATNGGAMVDITLRIELPLAPTYAVTAVANDATMGSVTSAMTEQDVYTMEATANEGYEFVNWTVAGSEVSSTATFTYTATADAEVVANFQIIAEWPATVEALATAEGLIAQTGVGFPTTTSASYTALQSAIEAATATKTIEQLSALETAISAYYAETDVIMPEEGRTYAFVLAESESSYLYINNNNGTLEAIEYDGISELPETAKFTTSIVDGDKYTFQSVVDNKYMAIPSNVAWLTAESQSATGLVESVSLVSKFDVSKLSAGANEYVTANANQLLGIVYLSGSRGLRTDNGLPEAGVIIVNNSTNAFDKSGVPYCNGVCTSAIRVVEVDYTPVYSVSAEASPAEGGQVTISTDEVEANSTVTLTATANEGYEFVNWTVAGEEVSVDANFTSEAITAETEFVANFQVKEYNVVYKVDGEEYQTVPTAFGSTITPIAEPEKEGYTFSGWSEVPETMPASDVEVTGTFTKNVYTVSVSVNNSAYGSVSPETANVEHGETITLTATANLGYQFVGWFEEGRNISNETNFSIIITSEKNYIATFEAIDKVNVTVVDENRTETKSTVYANVTVGNEKVWDVQANTISADKLSVSVDADGVASEVKIADGGQITTVLEVTRTIEKGKWALMSLPFAVDLANVTVDGVAAVNNSNIKVMVYDAAYRAANSIELFTKSGWKELTGTTIAANQGFAVAINANNGDEQKVTFTAISQTYDGSDKQISLSRYASTVNEGADADWNFYGNPTLAKAQKGTGYALYVYNAEDDSYDEYASSDVATYQPYAAWFVQSADDFNAMIFSAGVAGALAEADGVFGELQFSLNGDDEARIVLVDESSEEYVRNEDALYFPAINTNLSQLYLVKGNIKMAVSEQPSLTSMAMGYKAVKAGEQTLTLTSVPENTSVVLVDNVAGTETAMTLGDTYTFQSEVGTYNNRFVIETTDLTGISQAVADGEVKVLVSGTEINVYGAEAGTEVVAYTTNGTVVASAVAEEGVTTLSTSATGVIVVKVANTAVKVIK